MVIKTRLLPRLWTALVAVCCVCASASAQNIEGKPIKQARSSKAELRLDEVLRIGSMSGPNDAFGRVMDVALTPSGRILVADDLNHRVAVFQPNGNFLAHIGRQGNGPGEFGSPWVVAADRQDSIFVWDSSQGRISVFSPDLRFARSFQAPPQWLINDLRVLPDGRLLVAAYGSGERGTMHLLSRTGEREATFGPATQSSADLAGYESSLLGGSMDLAGQSIVWSRKSPYDLWWFDLRGRPQRRCVGPKSWTTDPKEVVQVTDNRAALRWKRFTHSSQVVNLGNGWVLNQVIDPANDRTTLDLVDSECRLLRRTTTEVPMNVVEHSGSQLVFVRNLDYPEVVVYQWRLVR